MIKKHILDAISCEEHLKCSMQHKTSMNCLRYPGVHKGKKRLPTPPTIITMWLFLIILLKSKACFIIEPLLMNVLRFSRQINIHLDSFSANSNYRAPSLQGGDKGQVPVTSIYPTIPHIKLITVIPYIAMNLKKLLYLPLLPIAEWFVLSLRFVP